ncbi:MAG: glycosyltransferase [Bdellovibrionaceae bacterium]|nr:glycosyltransferase [Pseudobdellovibrionaceae bacterium]
MKMRLGAVIVTFNRLEKLKITVQKTLEQSLDVVLIINNKSTDGTEEWLNSIKASDPRLKIFHLPKNVGGAGGFEFGFREIRDNHPADWLVCYDDDAYPCPGTIESFRALQLAPDVGAVAAAVMDAEGGVAEMNRPSLNPFASFKFFIKTVFAGRDGFHLPDAVFYKETEMYIDVSSFVGLFLRTDLLKTELGLPRGELFIYADDVLYTLKLRQLGYKNLFLSRLKFVHDCGSVKAGSAHFRHPFQPLWKVYYTYRNNIEVFRQISGILFLPIFLLKLCSWLLCARYYDNKKLYFSFLFTAVKHGLLKQYPYMQDELVALSKKI